MVRAGLLVLLLVTGCGNSSRGVRIDIIFQTSCTATPSRYNTECVSAVEARLLDAAGTVQESRCNTITAGTFPTALSLADSPSDDIVPVLENIRPREEVMIELRGYHGLVRDPCQQAPPQVADLMFWGRSDPVDLTDDSLEGVGIDIECRHACDCSALGEDSCPFAFDSSETLRVCTPPTRCRKSCSATSECWDGEAACIADSCQPAMDEGLCAECSTATGCDETEAFTCIRHSYKIGSTPQSEDFCAKPCPPASGLVACPGTMSCMMVDADTLTVLP